MLGVSAEIDEICKIAKKHKILVIDDNCGHWELDEIIKLLVTKLIFAHGALIMGKL